MLEAFDHACPEIGRKELRVCNIPDGLRIPPGEYLIREYYCNIEGCDCRRVVLRFIPTKGSDQISASINFGWEKERYYKKWCRDTALWREMIGVTLDRSLEQGPQAKRFVQVVKRLVRDHCLVASFRRHYTMVKEIARAAVIVDEGGNFAARKID